MGKSQNRDRFIGLQLNRPIWRIFKRFNHKQLVGHDLPDFGLGWTGRAESILITLLLWTTKTTQTTKYNLSTTNQRITNTQFIQIFQYIYIYIHHIWAGFRPISVLRYWAMVHVVSERDKPFKFHHRPIIGLDQLR